VVTCGGNLANNTNPSLFVAANSQNTTSIALPAIGCSTTNLGISLTAVCSRGGTTSTACPEGACFS